MKKTLQIWSGIILFLFVFPFLVVHLPGGGGEQATAARMKEPSVIVYAANIQEAETELEEKKVLVYFTHSSEAYESITKAVNGKTAVYHDSTNIMQLGETIQSQFSFNGIQTDVLAHDNNAIMNSKRIPFSKAYDAIRPYVAEQLKKAEYDLVIDVHRDSARREKTTLEYSGDSYARVAFVIGTDHRGYKRNEAYALLIQQEMEKLVPGITRDIIPKGGAGVDGKYNQDLHEAAILVELGGVGNTEDELNRTTAVFARAVSASLKKLEKSADK